MTIKREGGFVGSALGKLKRGPGCGKGSSRAGVNLVCFPINPQTGNTICCGLFPR